MTIQLSSHGCSLAAFVGRLAASLLLGLLCAHPRSAVAAAVTSPWPGGGVGNPVAVGAARLTGLYAVAETRENKVEVRDIRQRLLRTVTDEEMLALLPWMNLDGGPDGPSGIAVSDSGRQVFILVHDDSVAPDGGPSDGVLLYDTYDDALSLFARVNLFDRGDVPPLLAARHFRGRLYVGTHSDGVAVFQAGINNPVGRLLQMAPLPDGGPIVGLAVDADRSLLLVAGTNMLQRARLNSAPLAFRSVGSLEDVRAMAFGTSYGGDSNAGLYVLVGAAGTSLRYVPPQQARGLEAFHPTVYVSDLGIAFDVAATACGRLLVGTDEGARLIADDSDSRLSFDGWLTNEFDQVVAFCRELVAADGHGSGWVTDANTKLGLRRFHPCSPDGACWAVLAFLLADEIRGDTNAESLVQDILVRFAGMAPDGIRPETTADGIFRHWYNPLTGGVLGSWDPEFATLSTMKICLAAVRAQHYYSTNAVLRAAASSIIDGTKNHAAYVRATDAAYYFKGLLAGGPDPASVGKPFQEGILFIEQAAAFDDAVEPIYARWLDRSLWPTAELVSGKPVTGDVPGQFQAAFTSLYPWLLQKDFRYSPTWQQHMDNLWYSHAAWNDNKGPRFFTVFSAGTTPSGYNADSLSNHPHDIASLPALMAFSAKGDTLPAVAAYHAYRRGARQTFQGGASILYRRANWDPAWLPNSAGLPDVVLGAIGLAELIQPGVVDRVLALDMSGSGLQLERQGALLELSWPVLGWQLWSSTNLRFWNDRDDLPNPYRLAPGKDQDFFRLSR